MPIYIKDKTCPEVEIHPTDGEKLGVKDGDIVIVTSKIGSIEIPVRIVGKEDILPGVIQISHGWKDKNVNLITSDLLNDPISGFSSLRSLSVNIKRKIE